MEMQTEWNLNYFKIIWLTVTKTLNSFFIIESNIFSAPVGLKIHHFFNNPGLTLCDKEIWMSGYRLRLFWWLGLIAILEEISISKRYRSKCVFNPTFKIIILIFKFYPLSIYYFKKYGQYISIFIISVLGFFFFHF